jgi:hypothetical protein
MKNQQGYLLLIAAVLIVIIGFMGTAVVYMLAGSSSASIQNVLANQAFYVAEGGLEKANRYLLTPLLTGTPARITCAALTGNTNLTNSSLGSGTFTVTTVSGSPFFANSTLNGALNSSATSIAVASTSGFAASGRLRIEREAVNYAAISGNSFIGVTRGVNGTVASSHASGGYASQYQCSLDSLGGVANLTSPLAKRELQQGVQLQDAWAVGARSGNNFVFTHWNRPSEIQWSSALLLDSVNREQLQSISLTSNAYGWAVGVERNNNFMILRLAGSSWSVVNLSAACNGQDLEGVSTVSQQEAWAVGVRYKPTTCSSGNNRYTVLYFNGATWSRLTPSTTPSIPADNNNNQNLNAVHVIATTSSGAGNIGFAVGVSGQILKYNGSQWTSETSNTTSDLYGVFTVSTSEAWAVGQSGRIVKWNGSTWSIFSSPTSTQLNSVYMLDTNGDGLADAGWAVGNSGVAITYNGSSWSSQNAGGGNLLGVAAYSANDVWAAGAAGRTAHWDGSAWTNITSNVTTQLNGIAIVSPKQYPFAGWQEVFA